MRAMSSERGTVYAKEKLQICGGVKRPDVRSMNKVSPREWEWTRECAIREATNTSHSKDMADTTKLVLSEFNYI